MDDINLPNKKAIDFGSQTALELIRQWMDFGGWYDVFGEMDFKKRQRIQFAGTFGPERNVMTNRLMRHFQTY